MRELALAQTPVTEPEASDDILVREAQRNPAAFTPLYRRWVTPIYRYLYSRIGNRADAEDVTTEVFIEALRSITRYRERGTFAAWLFTIARHRAADHHRSSHDQVPFDERLDTTTQGEGDPLITCLERETLQLLARLVARLNQDEQELLRLRFAAGLSYGQIGELTGRREAAVKMAIHRLLKRLEQT